MRFNKYREVLLLFDMCQFGFTSALIAGTARSGANEFERSLYASTKSSKKEFVGTKARQTRIILVAFEEKISGARFGAPIVKNKLFFFRNFEIVDNTSLAINLISTGSPQLRTQISVPNILTNAESFHIHAR